MLFYKFMNFNVCLTFAVLLSVINFLFFIMYAYHYKYLAFKRNTFAKRDKYYEERDFGYVMSFIATPAIFVFWPVLLAVIVFGLTIYFILKMLEKLYLNQVGPAIEKATKIYEKTKRTK